MKYLLITCFLFLGGCATQLGNTPSPSSKVLYEHIDALDGKITRHNSDGSTTDQGFIKSGGVDIYQDGHQQQQTLGFTEEFLGGIDAVGVHASPWLALRTMYLFNAGFDIGTSRNAMTMGLDWEMQLGIGSIFLCGHFEQPWDGIVMDFSNIANQSTLQLGGAVAIRLK